MATFPGPFSVDKTKKWTCDSVEAPTIYDNTACASTFSLMLANKHEEKWQLANRTITDIRTKHPKDGTVPSWRKQVMFCQPLITPAPPSELALTLARSVALPPIFSTPSRYGPSRLFFIPTIVISLLLSLTRLVSCPRTQAPRSILKCTLL